MTEITSFIAELSGRETGDNLEYDADFLELFRQATEQQETQYGEHIYTPEPIEWRVVESLCLKLFQRTQDLRVATCLTRAWLERHGLQGLIDGLQVVSVLLQERWETLHPQLDPRDRLDPIMRINALAELAVPGAVPAALERQVLAHTPAGEAFNLSGLAVIVAGGESAQRTECLQQLGSLASPQCVAELESGLGLLCQLKALLLAIGECLQAHTGVFGASPLHALAQQVVAWVDLLEPMVDVRTVAAASSEGSRVEGTQDAVSAPGVPGECQNREQVLRALEAVERYYSHYEPSSPVPLLLQRVRRLAMMDFMQIVTELTPSSIEEVRQLAGLKND